MLTRGLFLLIFVMAAATNFLAGASTARAADVSCSGTLGGGTDPHRHEHKRQCQRSR